MNKEWYTIDVKKEVLRDIQNYLADNANATRIMELLMDVSVRDMMDVSFVKTIDVIDNPVQFAKLASESYLYHRNQKYGQEGFWESASRERSIGYSGLWYEFISDLLKKYCKADDKVLFVGTADGREIPNDRTFNYYALEQIGNSVNHIDTNKIIALFEADFEDDSFYIGDGKQMNAIVALRCLMPNTRLNRFFRFVENNLKRPGFLVVSHPMGFLNVNNEYKPLPRCERTLEDFDDRLKKELILHENVNIIYQEKTNVEYFYIMKVE